MASLAQDEIRRLSERVKFGMKESMKKGKVLGNQKLYGYIKEKNANNYQIVAEQASTVKKIFHLYANKNKSLGQIARILTKDNIKTINNKNFSASSLSRLIRNVKYKGYYCGGKCEVVDYMTKKVKLIPKEEWIIYKDMEKFPPIIDEKLWNKANRKLNKNSK